MKYLTLILCFLLPLLLVAEEVTVPVGNTEIKISVEEGKTEQEIKPPEGSDVLVIPFEKFSEYGITPLTIDEIKAQYPEDVEIETDALGSWTAYLTMTYVEGNPYSEIRTQAGTSRDGATPHFYDLWFNWRWNRLRIGNLHEGSMVQSYRYTYPGEVAWLEDGNVFRFRNNENYIVRAASGHIGYLPNTPGDPLSLNRRKTKYMIKPVNRVQE
jgi:hypothetical protein